MFPAAICLKLHWPKRHGIVVCIDPVSLFGIQVISTLADITEALLKEFNVTFERCFGNPEASVVNEQLERARHP